MNRPSRPVLVGVPKMPDRTDGTGNGHGASTPQYAHRRPLRYSVSIPGERLLDTRPGRSHGLAGRCPAGIWASPSQGSGAVPKIEQIEGVIERRTVTQTAGAADVSTWGDSSNRTTYTSAREVPA